MKVLYSLVGGCPGLSVNIGYDKGRFWVYNDYYEFSGHCLVSGVDNEVDKVFSIGWDEIGEWSIDRGVIDFIDLMLRRGSVNFYFMGNKLVVSDDNVSGSYDISGSGEDFGIMGSVLMKIMKFYNRYISSGEYCIKLVRNKYGKFMLVSIADVDVITEVV